MRQTRIMVGEVNPAGEEHAHRAARARVCSPTSQHPAKGSPPTDTPAVLALSACFPPGSCTAFPGASVQAGPLARGSSHTAGISPLRTKLCQYSTSPAFSGSSGASCGAGPGTWDCAAGADPSADLPGYGELGGGTWLPVGGDASRGEDSWCVAVGRGEMGSTAEPGLDGNGAVDMDAGGVGDSGIGSSGGISGSTTSSSI